MNSLKSQSYKQLLASILREKPDSYLMDELYHRFPTPAALADVTEEELLSVKGIGIARVRQILSTVQLVQEFTAPVDESPLIRSPKDVYELLGMELRYAPKELFVCLFLNTKNCVISKEVISIGTLNASLVHPREVFRAAIKRNSASIICCHNHPSGNPEPSIEDVKITKRLISAGDLIGIDLLDHIIIGGHRYLSLKEQGLLVD